jgi:hypothetical protein
MELGELLAERNLPTAVIDLDWLGWFHGPPDGPSPNELIATNLRAIWPTFQEAGASHLVLARAVTSRADVDVIRSALDGVELTVVLVSASPDVIAERLARRDEGEVLRQHLEESEQMSEALARAGLEDVRIENGDGSAREAAQDLLEALSWGP